MKVHWPMTFETYETYLEIHRALQAAHADQDHVKFQEQQDALQALPGFPRNVAEHDLVVPLIVTESYLNSRVTSIPSSRTIH